MKSALVSGGNKPELSKLWLNAERRLQIPAQGNALGSLVDFRGGTLKEFANRIAVKTKLGNPFRVGKKIIRFPQGSALNARNPGLWLVNAFGVLDYSSKLSPSFQVRMPPACG